LLIIWFRSIHGIQYATDESRTQAWIGCGCRGVALGMFPQHARESFSAITAHHSRAGASDSAITRAAGHHAVGRSIRVKYNDSTGRFNFHSVAAW
jgi:hypothetical protein